MTNKRKTSQSLVLKWNEENERNKRKNSISMLINFCPLHHSLPYDEFSFWKAKHLLCCLPYSPTSDSMPKRVRFSESCSSSFFFFFFFFFARPTDKTKRLNIHSIMRLINTQSTSKNINNNNDNDNDKKYTAIACSWMIDYQLLKCGYFYVQSNWLPCASIFFFFFTLEYSIRIPQKFIMLMACVNWSNGCLTLQTFIVFQ